MKEIRKEEINAKAEGGISMNKQQNLEDTERIFGKKYPLKDFSKLSDVKKKHRIIDIILNEHTYDAMEIFFYLLNEKQKEELAK